MQKPVPSIDQAGIVGGIGIVNTFVRRVCGIAGKDPGMLGIILVFLLLLPLSTPRIYATDEVQYYAYLPSVFFDHDLDFQNEYEHFATIGMRHGDPAVYNALLRPRPDDPPLHPQTGKYRNLAPIGSAILWAPGFLAAHGVVLLARTLGATIAADGYSWPYIWSVCFLSAGYVLVGLLLTYRLACRFVSRVAAALAVLSIWLASPLVFYTYIAMPWSHSVGFFLFALFLTLWLWGGEQQPLAERMATRSYVHWALLGIVGGLMTITREQLGLLLLLPAVEGLIAYARLLGHHPREGGDEQRPKRLLQLMTGHMVFLLCLVIAVLPQLMTYQVLNGQPFPSTVVSGKLRGSGGTSPHFFDTLFHPRHGAFLWSPLLLLGLIGLGWLVRRDWLLAWLLLLGFLVQTYINGSFGTTWHLSGSFGFRRLLDCTPVFALGLAMLVEQGRRWMGTWPVLMGAIGFVCWNFGLIAQWTFVRTELRAGLIWSHMLYYQVVEVPARVMGAFGDLLFNRDRFLTNRR